MPSDQKILKTISKWPWPERIFPVSTAADRSRRVITILTSEDDVSLYTIGETPHGLFAHVTYELIEEADEDGKLAVAYVMEALKKPSEA